MIRILMTWDERALAYHYRFGFLVRLEIIAVVPKLGQQKCPHKLEDLSTQAVRDQFSLLAVGYSRPYTY